MEYRHPDKKTCLELLEEYGTPKRVIKHCMAVADTGVKIAEALNKKGYHLDIMLIQAAGILHDIARAKDEHWIEGSKLAEKLGYIQEAEIIKKHMKYSTFSDINHINETDIVCLSDRLVKEDKYVGIDERMEYIIDKAERQGHPEAKSIILEKKKEIEKFIKQIEKIIGIGLDALMGKGK